MKLIDRTTAAMNRVSEGIFDQAEIYTILQDTKAYLQQSDDQILVAIKSLSYTEEKALIEILNSISDLSGSVIVTSQIADQMGISRSILINCIRKMESAGIFASRSMGMRGTYIKVLRPVSHYLQTPVAK